MTPTTTAPEAPPPADLIPADDPFLLDLVDRTLAPYAGRVTPEVFDDMRAALLVTLTTHPNCRHLVERARRAPAVERSGTREKPGAAPATPAAKEGRGR